MIIKNIYGASVINQHPMHVIVGYHGLDDQYVTIWVPNMACISFTKGGVIHLPSELLCGLLAQGVRICEQLIPCFPDIMTLGSSRLSGEVQPPEDGPNFARTSCLALVSAQLGASVTDIILEVPITDEFLDLILEHDTLLCGMADILVI